MMRIITGRAKGRKLKTLEGSQTRPTTERTKEAVFSSIQYDLNGRNVLDLFAGSGQMGLEALSRGAAHADFNDASEKAVSVIRENIKICGFEKDSSVFTKDYRSFLSSCAGKSYDLVFLDPPYARDIIPGILSTMSEKGLLNEGAIVICETGEETTLTGDDKLMSVFEIRKQATYGISHILILEYRNHFADSGKGDPI